MELPLTPLEFARRARKLYPDREAVIDGELRLNYAQFFDRCDRWSCALQRLGLKQGDRVAIIAPNTHAMLESFYAVPQLGAVLVPLNHRLSAEDFAYMIRHSGSRFVCAHADYLAAVDSIRDELPGVSYFIALEGARSGWMDYESSLAECPPEFERPAIAESDLLTINYTSGTTSRPKGVMITHRNAWMNSIGMLLHRSMTAADRYLWTLPMFHANGWTFVWTVTAVGAAHICVRKMDAATLYECIGQERITMLCAAPTVLITIASAPAQLRRNAPRGIGVLTGGAAPAAATIQRIEGELGWEITQVYGLTETAPIITICEPRPRDAQLDADARAVIKARQGVELITSGEVTVIDDGGHDVPHDGRTLGEIVVRGNLVMKGYYQDPHATELALRGGWFHSGDAAVIHPDGYIEIRDRFKDVIISGGENISSIEIEGALLRHPAVQEVAVVGVPDQKWGETPHAFVVLRLDAVASSEELHQFCREHMAHFKVPRHFSFIAELPKTATGKIQKFMLRNNRSAISVQ
ncbi:MAG: long-chain-fatty-acid--CoA ligase [Gammaproteobacteria bacterium]